MITMNAKRFILSTTATLLAATGFAVGGLPQIVVHSNATVSPSTVILDLVADTNGVALRGFGVRVLFNSAELSLTSAGTYDGLWFLRGENGVTHSYTDATIPGPGMVRLVGGRLDGNHPGEGVSGQGLLLGTLVFNRLTANDPSFEIELASPPPFANFASTEGGSLDSDVKFLEPVQNTASEDIDNDLLPDDYELDTFGDLVTSNGLSDTDKDGDSDFDELVKGTDPTDPMSKCRVRIVVQPDGSKLLVWNGAPHRVHHLLWSDDATSFETLIGGIPSILPELQSLDETHNANVVGFYLVETEYPTLGR
jgi:hypothetical protein